MTMDDNERAARAREDFKRESDRLASSKEVFNWVTQFNRSQALQIEQDVARAERAKADAGSVGEPAPREPRPVESGPPESGWDGREAFDRESEGRSRAQEVFDWVTQFNRTQAMQVEQDVARAERAKADADVSEFPIPERGMPSLRPRAGAGAAG